jgi:hypothetical protein
MIRKHFRLSRIIVSLAVAAFAAPAAYATPYVGGPTSETQSVTSHRPFASEISVQPTVTALQADGMRWQAIADAYLSQSPVRSENSFGAPGPSAGGASGPVATVSTSTSKGFDWSDASVGAGVTFGMTLLLLTAIVLGRRNRSRLASA